MVIAVMKNYLFNILLYCLFILPGKAQKAFSISEGNKQPISFFSNDQQGVYSPFSGISSFTNNNFIHIDAEHVKARNKRNATYFLYNPDSTPIVSFSSKQGQLHNTWQSWYQNRYVCDSGRLRKGIPDGVWKVWWKNGTLKHLRTYHADLLFTIKNEWLRHPKRSFYPITYIAQENSSKAFYLISHSASFGSASKNPNIFLSQLLQQNIHNHEQYHPPFFEGLLHGQYINYLPNGSVKDSGYYRYGLREGEWLESVDHEDMLAKGFYKHGIKTGVWKYYRNKKLIGLKEFDGNGKEKYNKIF
jgi:antitoxin component YwqK of YwqJK toxin-antitoxin module